MTVDWDGNIRMDPSSPYAMQSLIGLKDHFDVAVACDTDHDRHGIVTKSVGLMPPNHYLSVCIHYLFSHATGWRKDAAVGKTVVSSSMIDRVAAKLGRKLYEVPVGFKFFVDGLLDGALGFAGEESAGASFVRRDGTVWTTDKDGMIAALLAAEITSKLGRDPGEVYRKLTGEFGELVLRAHRRARQSASRRRSLQKLSPEHIRATRTGGRQDRADSDECAGRRQPDRRREGDLGGRLVRGASLRHGRNLQDLRREFSQPRASGEHPAGSAGNHCQSVRGRGCAVDRRSNEQPGLHLSPIRDPELRRAGRAGAESALVLEPYHRRDLGPARSGPVGADAESVAGAADCLAGETASGVGRPRLQAPRRRDTRAEKEAEKSAAWFQNAHPNAPLKLVAYFSMEYMLSEALPIYSGGLGNVAGDQLKAASDLGVPVVAVGLLYQQGYFRQEIDANGAQQALYPFNDPGQLPIRPVREANGEWLRLTVSLPGIKLWIRTWEVRVGRATLYLLDSNDPANPPAYRSLTSQLYGGGPDLRLRQEAMLGIAGWRLLGRLGLQPDVCHLNEGHAAFAVLERARAWMVDNQQPFDVALAVTRAGNVFTTHTAVERRLRSIRAGADDEIFRVLRGTPARHFDEGTAGARPQRSERQRRAFQHGVSRDARQRHRQRREPPARRGQPPPVSAALSAAGRSLRCRWGT